MRYYFSLTAVILLVFCSCDTTKGQMAGTRKIQIKTNKNVELFGLMMDLDAGADLLTRRDTVVIENKKTTWQKWYAGVLRNYLRYRQYDSCAVMAIYRKMAGEGYSDDWFVGFLLEVDDAPDARITAFTDPEKLRGFSKKGDTAEARRNALVFLAAFNDFCHAVDFDHYLEENKKYYALAHADVAKNLPGDNVIRTMESFYRQRFNAYCLTPSLTIPTSIGYGKTHRSTRTVYNFFAPFSFQSFDSSAPNMGFNYPDKIRGLTVHEFGHSFVNPAVDKLPKGLIDSTAYLYAPIKETMSRQAYVSWKACLYEHFVRAGEVIVAEKLGDTAGARKGMEDNLKGGFIYLPFIVEKLRAYDKDKSLTYDATVWAIIEELRRHK